MNSVESSLVSLTYLDLRPDSGEESKVMVELFFFEKRPEEIIILSAVASCLYERVRLDLSGVVR